LRRFHFDAWRQKRRTDCLSEAKSEFIERGILNIDFDINTRAVKNVRDEIWKAFKIAIVEN